MTIFHFDCKLNGMGTTVSSQQKPPATIDKKAKGPHNRYRHKRIGLTPVQEVLSVLPDAKLTYVEGVIEKLSQTPNIVNDTIEAMMQSGYEKESSRAQVYDFNSTRWTTSHLYRYHSLLLLQRNFPYIEENSLKLLFDTNNYHYCPTYKILVTKADFEVVYDMYGPVIHCFTTKLLAELEDKLNRPSESCIFIKIMEQLGLYRQQKCKLTIQEVPSDLVDLSFERLDTVLQHELDWMEEKQIEKQITDNERENKNRVKSSGASMECGCCFEDVSLNELRECSRGHQFCRTCIAKYVEQTVFGDGRSHLKCLSSIGSSSGAACDGHFSDATIRASVRGKVFSRYCEAVARDALKAAKLTDCIKSCYYCQFQVAISSQSTLIHCPNCYRSTCALCGEEAHLLRKNCPEKKVAQGRVTVEEAMTDARIRVSPSCQVSFIKGEGCTHITCRCGASICYACGQLMYSYTGHTVDHSHCRLDEISKVKMAGHKALEKVVANAKREGEDLKKYDIEVERFLQGGIHGY